MRRRIIQGEVHDENAASLGGEAGHAGLFATGEGVVSLLCSLWQNQSWKSAFDHGLRKVSGQRNHDKSWGPGLQAFDLPCVNSFCLGHLGFTGTSFWVDHTNKTYAIFLSNRVVSGRQSKWISSVRSKVARGLFSILNES